MAVYKTGNDPNAPSWPVNLIPTKIAGLPNPTGYALVGGLGSVSASLNSGTDTAYVTQQKADNYFRYQVGAYTLPQGARVSSVVPVVRACVAATNKRNSFVVGQGDHSGAKFALADNPPSSTYPLNTTFHNYAAPGQNTLANNMPITQADLERGLYILWGMNAAYGTSTLNPTAKISSAKLQLTYDMPPTSNITYPATGSTVSDTGAPLIVWDYFDDFQPQYAYQIHMYNSSSALVYNSGKVVSGQTAHQLPTNLSNGTYSIQLGVWQVWNGAGGTSTFSSIANSTSTFTISVPSIGTPALTLPASGDPAFNQVMIYPALNLLNRDASTLDTDVLQWKATGYTNGWAWQSSLTRDGAGSGLFKTNPTNTNYLLSAPVPVSPSQNYSAYVYMNPASGAVGANLTIQFLNSTGGVVTSTDSAGGVGAFQTLTNGTWNQVFVKGAGAPSTAAYALLSIAMNQGSGSANISIDDAYLGFTPPDNSLPAWTRGGFYEAATNTNVLTYADANLEDDSYIWTPNTNGSTASAVASTAIAAYSGARSLAVTAPATGMANNVSALLGTSTQLACTPGETLNCFFACQAGMTTGRTAAMYLIFYNAAGTLISGIPASNYGSSSNTVWTTYNGTVTVPAGAATFTVQLKSTTTSGVMVANETFYFDTISVYRGINIINSFVPGYYPNTDTAPVLTLQYLDNGGPGWQTLATLNLDGTNLPSNAYGVGSPIVANFGYSDYTYKSGVFRNYQAYISETENGSLLTSATSAQVTTSVNTFNGVYLHLDSDPVGTTRHYSYDGGGRTRTIDAGGSSTPLEGRTYGFAEFGTQSAQTVAVTLALPAVGDGTVLENLANSKGQVVFRDKRGRAYRGVMRTVTFADTNWGQTASFSLVLTGNQI